IMRNPQNLSINGTIFIKIDYDGTLMDSTFLVDEKYSLTGWEKNMRFLEDSSFMFVGSIRTELPFRPWVVTMSKDGTIIDSMILSDYAGNPASSANGKNWAID